MNHFTVFSQASNAKLNVSKSQVLSLSGQPLNQDWLQLFQEQRITAIYDRQSLQPIRYLGYFIIQSRDQALLVENQLLDMIDKSFEPHLNRGLSFRGRATVTNTLVLSKLWYYLRLLNPSQSFFSKLDSKIGTFISYCKKIGRFSVQHMKRAITEGGLGILDPKTQHRALQLRWSIPLLTDPQVQTHSNRPQSLLSTVLSWIRYLISTSTNTDPCLSLFSPTLRSRSLANSSIHSLIKPIIQTINTLPDPCTHVELRLPPDFALDLSINDIWFPSSVPEALSINSKSFNKIQVKNWYTYDHIQQRLVLRTRNDPLRKFPSLGDRFHRAATANHILVYPFFIHLLTPNLQMEDHEDNQPPFISVSSFYRIDLLFNQIDTKSYRTSSLQSTPLKYHTVSRMSPGLWKKFWKTKLNFRIKNVWYQLLHNKINTAVVTHRYMPDIVLSPLCPLCSTQDQHPEHMFVECQRVWQIWKKSLQYLFPKNTPSHLLKQCEVISALYSFRFPSVCSSFTLSPAFFFGSVMESIWSHYWKLIFDSVPFIPDQVVVSAIRIFNIYVRQQNTTTSTSPRQLG